MVLLKILSGVIMPVHKHKQIHVISASILF